jgi:hypothetical protein
MEAENARLRRAVSDLMLDKMILGEAARGKLMSPARRRVMFEANRAPDLPGAWAVSIHTATGSEGGQTMRSG